MKKLIIPFYLGVAALLSSCVTPGPKLKADVVGFNDDITTSFHYTNKCISKKMRKQSAPYNLLDDSDKQKMKSFVYELKQGQNTSALYALDKSLDRVQYVQKKFMENDPNSKYYVIMLTDGLDNNSLALANRNKSTFAKRYNQSEEYGNAVHERMNTIMRKYYFFDLFSGKNNKNQFQSFVLLYKGINSDNYTEAEYEQKLESYTGAQNIDRPTPIVGDNFEILLEKFNKELIQRDFSFGIPNGYIGKKVRMVLNVKKNIYFEGDFVREGKELRLKNITGSDGLTMKSTNIYGGNVSSNSNSVIFTVEDLQLNGTPYRVARLRTEQWFLDMGKLRQNSEYRSQATSNKNAYILIILDSSLSFGNKFREAQEAILKIVDMVSDL